MNVGQLIELLSKVDPLLPVGVLHDNGVYLTDAVGVHEGTVLVPHGSKMKVTPERRTYVSIGNPGDFDGPATECKLVKQLHA